MWSNTWWVVGGYLWVVGWKIVLAQCELKHSLSSAETEIGS